MSSHLLVPEIFMACLLIPLGSSLYTYSVVAPILAAVETSPTPTLTHHHPSKSISNHNNNNPIPLLTTTQYPPRHPGLTTALTIRLTKALLLSLSPLPPLQPASPTSISTWFLYNALLETLLSIPYISLIHTIVTSSTTTTPSKTTNLPHPQSLPQILQTNSIPPRHPHQPKLLPPPIPPPRAREKPRPEPRIESLDRGTRLRSDVFRGRGAGKSGFREGEVL
ncbi:hypothetical protein BO71DRAFT_426924 [Aspergillus ellipticus CBS 707.79]|uniref:Uncharacterized protein n=1 Tax=Aspergillus ellipticus CBS 707.79 TaxID=1448320 RepID=A0A319DJ87_9EURO|nr:hypothetical protein BO71DRAFT_426924 [Aspergillus ellipticus CBS 707.79]